MQIKDKVAIVTGGANGIRYDCVSGLLQKGARYVAIFNSAKDNSSLADIEKQFDSHRVELYTCDISNEDDFRLNFQKVTQKQKYVDILINDAGVTNENQAAHLIDVNVKGTILGNLIGIEYMGKHKGGQGGVIVNVASVVGLLDCNMMPVYSAAEHAIVSFTRSMKENGQGIGVRIFAICPGHTKKQMKSEVAEENSKNYLDFIPRGHIEQFHNVYVQSHDNVGNAVVHLISDAECGTVWIVENDEDSYKISSFDHYVKKIIDNHETKVFFC